MAQKCMYEDRNVDYPCFAGVRWFVAPNALALTIDKLYEMILPDDNKTSISIRELQCQQ